MTILHGHKHHVSSQMQVEKEQGNDCGGGDVYSVYSKYSSTARNYHNGLYTSISKFSFNQTLHFEHLWSEQEA